MVVTGMRSGKEVLRSARSWHVRALLALLVLLLTACAGSGAQSTPTPRLDLSATETPPAPAPSANSDPTATTGLAPTSTRVATATAMPRPTVTAAPTRRPTTIPTGPTETPLVLSNPTKLSRVGLEDEPISLVAVGGTKGETVFAVGEGVLRSVDGGVTWKEMLNGDDAPKVTALVVAPSNPQVVYVGVSEGCATTAKRPGFVSQDSGDTWTEIGNNLLSIAVDPQNHQALFAVDCRGLVRSTNGGRSWTVMEGGPVPAGLMAYVAIAPTATQNLYVAVDKGSGKMSIARSADRGETWQGVTPRIEPGLKVGQVLPGAESNTGGARPLALALNATNPAIALVSTTHGLFRTEDGGENWILIGEGLEDTFPESGGRFNTALVGDPRKGGTFWVGTGFETTDGVGLYRTRDQGETWRKSTSGLDGKYIFALALGGPANSRVLYIATDDGVWALTAP